MNYDNWKSNDLEEVSNDGIEKDFESWLDRQDDTEALAKYAKKDLVLYVSEEGLSWDYPDTIQEQFIDDFREELATYYLNNGE